MKKIQHRINKVSDLKNVSQEYGVELDIRAEGDNLILSHDAFISGENFEDYLKRHPIIDK